MPLKLCRLLTGDLIFGLVANRNLQGQSFSACGAGQTTASYRGDVRGMMLRCWGSAVELARPYARCCWAMSANSEWLDGGRSTALPDGTIGSHMTLYTQVPVPRVQHGCACGYRSSSRAPLPALESSVGQKRMRSIGLATLIDFGRARARHKA